MIKNKDRKNSSKETAKTILTSEEVPAKLIANASDEDEEADEALRKLFDIEKFKS